MGRILMRQIRAEWVKASSLPGLRWAAPLALLLGVVAALAMCAQAVVAKELLEASAAGSAGGGAATSWEPVQVLHWIRLATATVMALWAVGTVTGDYRGGTLGLTHRACRRWWVVLAAKWAVTGLATAIVLAVAVPLCILPAMAVFPSVTGGWSLGDPEVLHGWWTLAVYGFLLCGIAVGLGAVSRTATLGVGGLLTWQFVVEPMLVLAPGGATLHALLPLANGATFIGEETQFPLPFGGPMLSGLWVLLWALALLALGRWAMAARHR
ncbi:hypothetical protein [Corynebacterium sp. 335C]